MKQLSRNLHSVSLATTTSSHMKSQTSTRPKSLFNRSKRVAFLPGLRHKPPRPYKVVLPSRKRARFSIPPELYSSIIQWVVDTQDLCNLCLTSRLCYIEAQRVLYRIIDLAQNTETPVLWATTILRHPYKASLVRSLTMRFDLAFLIVPDMLLPSLRLISQALGALEKLEKLVFIGHPLVMMHPIYTWVLNGCTANLISFHNSVFPPIAIVPFLSKHPKLLHWKQAGIFEDSIPDNVLPHLVALDAHASTLTRLTTPRPLKYIRLNMNHFPGRQRTCERKAVQSLALFSTTLSTLLIDHSTAMPNQLKLADILSLLAQSAPKLKALIYIGSPSGPWEPFSQGCAEQLSNFPELEILVLRSRSPPLRAPEDDQVVAERAFRRCPPLRYVALGGEILRSFARQENNYSGRQIDDLLDVLCCASGVFNVRDMSI